MKNTKKHLMLTIALTLVSGQALQADWTEKYEYAKKQAKSAEATVAKTAGQVKKTWGKIDSATKKKALNIATSLISAYVNIATSLISAYASQNIDPALKEILDANIIAIIDQAAGMELDDATKKALADVAVKTALGVIQVGVIQVGSEVKDLEISDQQKTGLDDQRTGAVVGRDILKPENKATLDNIIRILTSGSFKGNRFKQEQFLGAFSLTKDEIENVMKKIRAAEGSEGQESVEIFATEDDAPALADTPPPLPPRDI